MDITFVEGNNFKIKSKSALVTTSPFQINEKIIYGPGEYEISGVSVLGWKNVDKTNIFLIEIGKLSTLFLGDSTGKLESNLIDEIGDTDVVLVSCKEALNEALRLEPSYIIATSEDFVKELGQTPEVTNKFSIKKEDMIEGSNTKIVVLTRK